MTKEVRELEWHSLARDRDSSNKGLHKNHRCFSLDKQINQVRLSNSISKPACRSNLRKICGQCSLKDPQPTASREQLVHIVIWWNESWSEWTAKAAWNLKGGWFNFSNNFLCIVVRDETNGIGDLLNRLTKEVSLSSRFFHYLLGQFLNHGCRVCRVV